MIEFDAQKDLANIAKHGVSLVRAGEMENVIVVTDDRQDYGEPRYRAFGWIEGVAYCLAFTLRGQAIRAISLRRARARELKRYET